MQKNKSILVWAIFCGSLLAACGGTNANSTQNSSATGTSAAASSAATSSVAPVVDPWEVPSSYTAFTGDPKNITATVTFWETFGASSNNATIAAQAVDAFKKLYPNITVNLVSKDSYPNIFSAVCSAIPAGTTPTMAICYPDHVAEYLNSGVMENMAGYASDPVLGFDVKDDTGATSRDDFYSDYLNEGTEYLQQGVYSLPYSKSTEVMFYNKTQFDANNWTVPTTWNEMWSTCAAIKAVKSDSTFHPLGYDSDDNLFITRSAQSNLPYTSLTAPHYLFVNDQSKAMVKELKENYDKGHFITKGSSANSSYTSTQFTTQTLYMTVGSTGGTNYNFTSDFDVEVAAIPQADVNSPKVISQGPSICFFNRASKDELRAAWLFYKFITNAANSANLSTVTGYNPVRKSSFETEVYKAWAETATDGTSNGLIKKALEFANSHYSSAYFTSPAFKGSATCRTQVGGLVANVLLGTKTVDTAFADAYNNAVIAS